MFDCTRDAFQISLQHDWQIENGFLMSQSRRASNPGTQVGTQNKDFGTVLQTLSLVCGAG